MHRPGGCCVRELPDCIDDPEPGCLASGVTSCPEVFGVMQAFNLSRVAAAFKHQFRHAPDVDFGYHPRKLGEVCP
jgi:hypothetical protein